MKEHILTPPPSAEPRINVTWDDLGLQGRQKVRDLWRQKDLGSHAGSFSAMVNPHGVVLINILRFRE